MLLHFLSFLTQLAVKMTINNLIYYINLIFFESLSKILILKLRISIFYTLSMLNNFTTVATGLKFIKKLYKIEWKYTLVNIELQNIFKVVMTFFYSFQYYIKTYFIRNILAREKNTSRKWGINFPSAKRTNVDAGFSNSGNWPTKTATPSAFSGTLRRILGSGTFSLSTEELFLLALGVTSIAF